LSVTAPPVTAIDVVVRHRDPPSPLSVTAEPVVRHRDRHRDPRSPLSVTASHREHVTASVTAGTQGPTPPAMSSVAAGRRHNPLK